MYKFHQPKQVLGCHLKFDLPNHRFGVSLIPEGGYGTRIDVYLCVSSTACGNALPPRAPSTCTPPEILRSLCSLEDDSGRDAIAKIRQKQLRNFLCNIKTSRFRAARFCVFTLFRNPARSRPRSRRSRLPCFCFHLFRGYRLSSEDCL